MSQLRGKSPWAPLRGDHPVFVRRAGQLLRECEDPAPAAGRTQSRPARGALPAAGGSLPRIKRSQLFNLEGKTKHDRPCSCPAIPHRTRGCCPVQVCEGAPRLQGPGWPFTNGTDAGPRTRSPSAAGIFHVRLLLGGQQASLPGLTTKRVCPEPKGRRRPCSQHVCGQAVPRGSCAILKCDCRELIPCRSWTRTLSVQHIGLAKSICSALTAPVSFKSIR